MPLEGFKVPGSFLKRKIDQEQKESVGTTTSLNPAPVTRRAEFPSSRLFGNLTRGGPTSVQNPSRSEGVRFTFNKPKERQFSHAAQESSSGFSDRSHGSGDNQGESLSRYKLVRNVDRGKKLQVLDRRSPLAAETREERQRPASIFRKRSSGSLAASAAAAVKRATKLVRAKRSNSREELAESKGQNVSSTEESSLRGSQIASPSKFRAASYAAESLTATREQAVILRSLLALIGRHCPTEYDKYVLLEERDKLLSKLREEENKKSDGKREVAEGTCPGMCSEKERYVRVVQKRISPYECNDDGTLNSSRMVKEYARSAADQDKPLPHELRSKEMLENSMGYLLKQVLDSVPEDEDDLAVWYDFLWSRTRAIRKEITQLMLTDKVAVSLIERCARLHILCAYKLCRLGFDKFDQNMNTENLAKCLQSLRHLYEDLALQAITVETEAEFRGYDVMLHLYDSNILRQVLSYRKEVRDSKPVRLALQLSSALQNKNYVRFFRLLKKDATFLQCCICHRYFNDVQAKALLTMMTAYGRNSVFPLDTIWRVLAWDDREDALKSLALYGVQQNDMDCDQVVLNRDHFIQDAALDLKPYRWVNAKNSAPLSQVAHGPTAFYFSPTSAVPDSFDVNNIYNKDEVLASVLERYSLQSEAQQMMLTGNRSEAAESRRQESRETVQWIKSKVERIVNEVVDEQSSSLCRTAAVDEFADSLSNSLIDSLIRKTVTEALLAEREVHKREQAFVKSQREEEKKGKLVQQLVGRIIDEVRDHSLKKAVEQELHDAIRVHINNATQFIVDELWRTKLVHIVDKEIKNILKRTLKTDLEEIQMGLQRFRERMELLWLRQFWDVWRAKVLENRRKRLERLQSWEHFQGVWDCKLFSPVNYVSSANSTKRSNIETSPVSNLINARDVSTTLRVIQFRNKRSNRIARSAFERWRDYVERRLVARNLAKIMLHRRKSFDPKMYTSSSHPYEEKAKRRRVDSPFYGSIRFSHTVDPLRDSSNVPDMHVGDSFAKEDSEHMKSFSGESHFSKCGSSQMPLFKQTPFRPPSPRVHEYCGEDRSISFSTSLFEFSRHLAEESDIGSEAKFSTSAQMTSSDAQKNSKEEELLSDASSLHAKMLKFSKDLDALIMRRKEADAECSRLAAN